MGGRVGFGAANIDDIVLGRVGERGIGLDRRQVLRLPLDEFGAVVVHLGVVLEVRGGVGQPFQHGGDKLAPPFVRQIGVRYPLLTDRRRRGVAQLGAAERACSVGRQDEYVVGKLCELLVPRVEHHRRQGRGGHPLAQQIGTPHAADEQRVAGEDRQRFIRVLLAGYQGAGAIRRMSGCLQDL